MKKSNIYLVLFVVILSLLGFTGCKKNYSEITANGYPREYLKSYLFKYSYNLEYKSNVNINFHGVFDDSDVDAGGLSSPEIHSTCIYSKLDLMYFTEEVYSNFFILQFRKSSMLINNIESRIKIDNNPIFVKTKSDGQIDRLWFYYSISDMEKEIISNLISLLQISIKKDNNNTISSSWSTIEKDNIGNYKSDYKLESASPFKLIINKVRKSYLYAKSDLLNISENRNNNVMTLNLIKDSNFDISISNDRKDRILDIKGYELQDIYLMEKIIGSIDYSFSMHINDDYDVDRYLGEGESQNIVKKFISTIKETSSQNIITDRSSAKILYNIYKNELGDLSIDCLMERLNKLNINEDPQSEKVNKLRSKFKAILFLKPGVSCPIIERYLINNSDLNLKTDILLTSLAVVGNIYSQNVLIKFFNERDSDVEWKKSILYLMGQFIDRPEDNIIDFMFNIFFNSDNDELALISGFYLGIYANRLVDYSFEKSIHIVNVFTELLNKSIKKDEKIYYLNLLGNSRSKSIIDTILYIINNDKDEEIRSVAISNIALVKDGSVDILLLDLLKSNSEKLKIQIINNLKSREPNESILKYLQKLLIENDHNDLLNFCIIEYFNSNDIIKSRSDVKSSLNNKFRLTSNEEIKSYIKKLF